MTPVTIYSPLQRALHWLVAAAVAILLTTGIYMVRRYLATANDAMTIRIYEIHKTIGCVVFLLMLLRLGLRLRRGAPAWTAGMPQWQQTAAGVMHDGLYALLLMIPLLGWLGVSAERNGDLIGGITLPSLLAHDDDLGWRVLWWHGTAAIVLGVGAVAHTAAALAHLLIFKDGIFQRMWRSPAP